LQELMVIDHLSQLTALAVSSRKNPKRSSALQLPKEGRGRSSSSALGRQGGARRGKRSRAHGVQDYPCGGVGVAGPCGGPCYGYGAPRASTALPLYPAPC